MYNFKKTVLPKSTIQYIIDIPKTVIQKNYEDTFVLVAKEVEIAGFRKGKAPLDIAKREIRKEKIYEQMLQKMMPDIYQKLIKTENLKPIISPKIELIRAQEGEDWQVQITIAEKPPVNLGQYKEHIKKALLDYKKEDIWVPGKTQDNAQKNTQKKEEQKSKMIQSISDTLLQQINTEVSDLFVENELEKRLTQLVDDVRKIGLTMEAYLKSKNETTDSIKAKLTKEIKEMYTLELILGEIAEKENITVDNKDFEVFFASIKDEKAREEIRKNAYFYATLLRRQKTLDYLITL